MKTLSIEECKSRLLELIKEKALIVGRFILSSGKESNYYLDERIVTLSSEGAYLTARVMLDILKDVEVDAIGGMTLAADPIVSAVTTISYIDGRPINGFIVRKEPKGHGTGKLIEGPAIKGLKAVIVDGTMTTGASVFKSIDIVQNEGAEVVKVLVLIDRLEGGGEFLQNKGYEVSAVFTRDDLLGD